ncbi:MAG: O-antigen ligase family protein [Elusimicrobia bacterium]|nr:O-antigen ligase family protein [Elusimicrobiota bacterium]
MKIDGDRLPPAFAGALAVVVLFGALARGAHDLWAATVVHAALIAWVVVALIWSAIRGPRLRFPLLFPACGVVAAWTLSALFAANRSDALFAVKDVVATLAAFYAGANALRDDADLDLLLFAVVPALWIQAVVQGIQIGLHGQSFGGEAPGLLINANVQAAFVLFWIPPLWWRWHRARLAGEALALYWAAGLAAAAFGLAFAGSAWAWALVGGAALVHAARWETRPGRRKGLYILAAGLVVAIVAYKLTKSYSWGPSDVPPRSADDRLWWWRSALWMFRTNPLVGVGPGGFPSAYPAFKIGEGQSTRFAHSWPLSILAETGVVGGIAVACFAAEWLKSRDRRPGYRACFATGAGLFALFALVNIGPEYLVNALCFALFLGAAGHWDGAPSARPRPSIAAVAAALAVFAGPFIAAPLIASRLIVDGTEDLSQAKFADARRRFDAAASADPTSWEAFHGRALATWSAPGNGDGRHKALVDIDRACRLNRLDATVWWERGLMLRDAGHKPEALASLRRAHELNPRHRAIADDLATLEASAP